jgi:hypothetical protein
MRLGLSAWLVGLSLAWAWSACSQKKNQAKLKPKPKKLEIPNDQAGRLDELADQADKLRNQK